MLDDFLVIKDDSFLSVEEQDYFLHSFFGEQNRFKTRWTVANVVGSLMYQKNKNSLNFQESNIVYFKDANAEPLIQIVGYPSLEDIKPVLDKFASKHNLEFYDVSRIKINVLQSSRSKRHHYPHVDTDQNHYVFIYYFNDSDGDTVLYNKTKNDILDLNAGRAEAEEILRITPKAGTALLFDGGILHAATPPEDSPFRIILNVNLQIKKMD